MENKYLDQFLREQVEAADLPMQEAHWLKAAAMLDAMDNDEKQKRPFAFWRGLSILIGILFVGTAAYLLPKLWSSKNKQATTKNTIALNNTNILPKQQTTETNYTQANINNTNKEVNNTNNNNLNTEVITETIKTENQKSNETKLNVENNIVSPENNTVTTKPNVVTVLPTNLISSNLNPTIKKIKNTNLWKRESKKYIAKNNAAYHTKKSETSLPKTNENLALENNLEANNNDVKNMVPTKNMVQKNAINKSAENIETEKKLAKNEKLKQATLPKKAKKVGNNILSTKTVSNKITKDEISKNAIIKKLDNTKINTTEIITKNTDAKTFEELNIEQINKARAAKNQALIPTKNNTYYRDANRDETIYNPRYLPNAQKAIKAKEVSADTSSIASVAVTPTLKTFNPIVNKLWWFVASGIFLNKGFLGNIDTAINFGLAPYISTGIEKEINSKLTICTQVGLTYFNALNTKKEQTNYRYSFGYDSTNYKIEYKKLMQLYVPITAYWQFAKKQYLLGGFGINYTFNTQSKVQQNPAVTATQEFGYMQGFKTLDAFATIGYAFKPNNRITFEASVQQGFADITDNNFFNNTLNNKLFRASVGIKYNIKNLQKSR